MDKKEFIKLGSEYLDKFFRPGKSYNFKVSSTKLEVMEVKKSTAPEWFKDFADKQEKFNEEVISRLDRVEQDIKDIKSCPTIQKELKK